MYQLSGRVTWEWFAFFSLQGALVIAEHALSRVRLFRSLPSLARNLLTMLSLIITSESLLYPPMLRIGLCEKIFPQFLGLLRIVPPSSYEGFA